MYGSFNGDIIGAPYEFDYGPRDKNFRFFAHPESRYTDDSLLTVAIGEALMNLKKRDMSHLPAGKTKKQVCMEAIAKSIRKWSLDSRYSHIEGEYGANFRLWLRGKEDKGWASYGNGSAMRVGPAGWLYDSLEANSYEEAIQNAISIGGDTDTIGAIAGSMAEALYGVPPEMREKAKRRRKSADPRFSPSQ